MNRIKTKALDRGRLIVNSDFERLLLENDLGTFDAIMRFSGGRIVKKALKERYTTKITLDSQDGAVNCFLKRYLRSPITEYFKQIIRLTRPIFGARNEWEALVYLNRLGVPTAVPVAYGECQGRSFTMTLAIENIIRACDWFEKFQPDSGEAVRVRRKLLVEELARIVRKMHDSGINHQDLYLCHFLVRFEGDVPRVFIIDNQRVMVHSGSLPERWRVKDLAQFCFSASCLTKEELEYFFEKYGVLHDGHLIAKIFRKKEKIEKHTIKNKL